ncbi:hypothetical protein [Cerasicoccus maritimus]|uniref:hypothetical protein n=1 Tax=Cerasicoccus maritimus TaxID=490089 RepID=UPI0028527646|nr:hypothetical protein [Cerasicoccus maritimus]
MVRTASKWDHRLLIKIALFGGLAQLVLIPVFILIGNAFAEEEEVPSSTVVEAEVETAEPKEELPPIHKSDGTIDPWRLLQANRQRTYGDQKADLHSLIARGTLAYSNGDVAEFSLMRRDEDKIREIAETHQIRLEYISDGETVRRTRSRISNGSTSDLEPAEESLWRHSRLAPGMPLGQWPGEGTDVSVSQQVDGAYRLVWSDSELQYEVWLNSDTQLVAKSRLAQGEQIIEATFADYREVDSMRLPHQIAFTYSDGRFPESIQVDEYQINPGLLPSLFAP